MDVESVLNQLWAGRVPITQLRTVPSSGVYALFLHSSPSLGTFPAGRDGLVYIGKTSDLEQRNLHTHFFPKNSGFSSPRRSSGTILKDELELTAQPRSPGMSSTNFTNYAFTPDGEERLSQWMGANLLVSTVTLPPGEETVMEEKLLSIACPVLNLTGCENPHRQSIKALRKDCANQARQSSGLPER
jgi:hypothetical protein